jgi:hypothetical protein
MLFAFFGIGFVEMAILGACCMVPFVVGVIAFFLMFRGGGTNGDGASYGKRPPAEKQDNGRDGADDGPAVEDLR